MYEKEYISNIMKIINSLRYIKHEQENKLNKFEVVHAFDIHELFCNKDWYIIEYKDGYIEEFNISKDIRSITEIEEIRKNKTLIKK